MAEMQWTPSNGWASYMITPSSYSPGAYTPVASLSRQVPPLNGSFTLVPASGTSPATTNLQGTVDSFWFDASGGLHWTYSWPGTGWITNTIFSSGGVPSGRLAATSRTPTTMDVFWVEAGGELAWFDYPADAGAVTTTGFATSGVASGVDR